MKALKQHKGLVATLDRANVDTDQIIPKQFLKSIQRTGFGENLFYDWRYRADGSPNPDFSLNAKRFKNASVLLTRNNFGCGSSREHAVWAIEQYGFRVLIAPWVESNGSRVPAFADIFRNNCGKNAVLTIELSSKEVDQIFELVGKNPGLEATTDVQKQQITFHAAREVSFKFDLDPATKERLLQGLDDIGLALAQESAIADFEKKHDPQLTKN